MDFRIEKGVFPAARSVCWTDVINKVEHEFKLGTQKVIMPPGLAPTFVLHQNWFPQTLRTAYDEVKEREGVTNMHTYLSFGASKSFGNHADSMDVLIVQAVGSVSYVINDIELFDLNPGDAIWIPNGIFHNPIIREPRVTLSFSWD